MANRAYLYFSDQDPKGFYSQFKEYYDSRRNIPVLWWLFFAEDNVKVVKGFGDFSDIDDLVFFEEWSVALERFKQRYRQFLECLPFEVGSVDAEAFLNDLDKKSKKTLICDPGEILEDGIDAINEMKEIFRMIDDQETSDDERYHKINKWTCLRTDKEKIELDTIGVTYS